MLMNMTPHTPGQWNRDMTRDGLPLFSGIDQSGADVRIILSNSRLEPLLQDGYFQWYATMRRNDAAFEHIYTRINGL